MKKSSKKMLEKRGILVTGRAQNAGAAQVHVDKRRPPRQLEKQRLKTQLQHETARNRGPFPFVGLDSQQLISQPSSICALNDQAYPLPKAQRPKGGKKGTTSGQV